MSDFSAADARSILRLIGPLTVAEMMDGNTFDAVSRLVKLSNDRVGIYIRIQGTNGLVEGVKAIRALTGANLRAAKDLYDSLDPHRTGGILGPIVETTPDNATILIANAVANGAANAHFHGNIYQDLYQVYPEGVADGANNG